MRSRPTALVVAAAVIVGGTACSGTSGAEQTSATAASATTADITVTSADSPATTAGVAAASTAADTTAPVAASATTSGAVADTATAPPARLDDTLDVDQIAARLSASHSTMIDPTADPGERATAGIDHQLVLRALAARPELDDEVLAALEPAARPAVERIIRARRFLQERTAARPPEPLPDELPAWTIAEAEPVATLLADYAEAERLTGIAWYWLAAIHLQETRMGRIEGVSTAGAVGPMQFLPTTWAVCCTGDPTIARDAIIGAATYLAQSGGPDDMAAALYQYNPNDGYVAVVTAYAESLRDEPELYTGYHAFQVFVGTSAGTVRLPVGYSQAAPIDAAGYLVSNPQDAA